MASTSCCCCYNSGNKLLWESFRTKDGCCFRIDNQVMMRRWLWMKHFAQLWSMGCHQLVVGDWGLIGLRCCSLILKISRLGCFSVHYFLLLEKLLNCWCKCVTILWCYRKFFFFLPWSPKMSLLCLQKVTHWNWAKSSESWPCPINHVKEFDSYGSIPHWFLFFHLFTSLITKLYIFNQICTESHLSILILKRKNICSAACTPNTGDYVLSTQSLASLGC